MVVIEYQGNDFAGYTTYFKLTAGDAVDITTVFTLLRPSPLIPEPIDISGAEIKMTIALPTPLELTIDNGGIVVVDAAAGTFRIVIPSDVTYQWPACQFDFDLWVIIGSSAYNFMKGLFIVKRGETVVP